MWTRGHGDRQAPEGQASRGSPAPFLPRISPGPRPSCPHLLRGAARGQDPGTGPVSAGVAALPGNPTATQTGPHTLVLWPLVFIPVILRRHCPDPSAFATSSWPCGLFGLGEGPSLCVGGAQPRGNFPLYLLHPPPPPANRSWYRKMKFVIVGAVLASLPGGNLRKSVLSPARPRVEL